MQAARWLHLRRDRRCIPAQDLNADLGFCGFKGSGFRDLGFRVSVFGVSGFGVSRGLGLSYSDRGLGGGGGGVWGDAFQREGLLKYQN